MLYPYLCETCGPFEVIKPMAQASRPEPCPTCDTEIPEQDYLAKGIKGFVSTEGNWSDGKQVVQLHPAHPDYMVTSKKQMERVYKENGLSMDTGQFVSEKAQIAATVPRNKRTGAKAQVTAGVQNDA